MSAAGLAQGILGNCCFTDVHSAKNIAWRQTLQLVSKKTTACKIAQNLKRVFNHAQEKRKKRVGTQNIRE